MCQSYNVPHHRHRHRILLTSYLATSTAGLSVSRLPHTIELLCLLTLHRASQWCSSNLFSRLAGVVAQRTWPIPSMTWASADTRLILLLLPSSTIFSGYVHTRIFSRFLWRMPFLAELPRRESCPAGYQMQIGVPISSHDLAVWHHVSVKSDISTVAFGS